MKNQLYNPYFFDGTLHFPKATLENLVAFGMPVQLAKLAYNGIELDDQENMNALRDVISHYIHQVPKDDPVAQVLASREVHFLIYGTSTSV